MEIEEEEEEGAAGEEIEEEGADGAVEIRGQLRLWHDVEGLGVKYANPDAVRVGADVGRDGLVLVAERHDVHHASRWAPTGTSR